MDSYKDTVPQDKNARKVEKLTGGNNAKISAEVTLQVLTPKQDLHKMKIKGFSRAAASEFPPTPLKELSLGCLH